MQHNPYNPCSFHFLFHYPNTTPIYYTLQNPCNPRPVRQRFHLAAHHATIGVILGIYWDNGKENGNYRDYRGLYRGYMGIIGGILGLYWDNGKENGNYRDYRDYTGVILG